MTYCFLDIETTGLDPNEDCILEIAWAFTDEHFNLISAPQTYLVDHYEDWSKVWTQLSGNEIPREMHTKSGLYADLRNPSNKLVPLDDVCLRLEKDLQQQSADGLIHLAGRSVHFDKSFLLANKFDVLFDDSLPASFHHKIMDFSSVKLLLNSVGVDDKQFEVENLGPHRAVNDVLADIGFARNLRSYLEGKFL